MSQPPQGIDANGICRKEIGKVHADVSPDGGARAPQLVHLFSHQASREQYRPAARTFDDLDSTVHGRSPIQD